MKQILQEVTKFPVVVRYNDKEIDDAVTFFVKDFPELEINATAPKNIGVDDQFVAVVNIEKVSQSSPEEVTLPFRS